MRAYVAITIFLVQVLFPAAGESHLIRTTSQNDVKNGNKGGANNDLSDFQHADSMKPRDVVRECSTWCPTHHLHIRSYCDKHYCKCTKTCTTTTCHRGTSSGRTKCRMTTHRSVVMKKRQISFQTVCFPWVSCQWKKKKKTKGWKKKTKKTLKCGSKKKCFKVPVNNYFDDGFDEPASSVMDLDTAIKMIDTIPDVEINREVRDLIKSGDINAAKKLVREFFDTIVSKMSDYDDEEKDKVVSAKKDNILAALDVAVEHYNDDK